MDQDLIEWLRTTKSQEQHDKDFIASDGTDLLLAPYSYVAPTSIEIKETPHEEETLTLYPDKNSLEEETTQSTEETEDIKEVKNLSEWHETATKFDLSLDEPPIEIWTQISESIEAAEDYEQSMSLQGDAYVQLPTEHGKNFTQRLHKTLKERQHKAEILREEEEKERRKNHPYTWKSVILCSILVIEVALLCFILFALNHRLIQNKQNEIQTTEQEIQVEPVSNEIEIILPQIEAKIPESHDESEEIEEFEVEEPLTFDELLQEAIQAHYSGVYDIAIIIYHNAIEMNQNDIRPYLGLAESYKAKGMFFDAKRILDEASAKFGRDPTLEVELKILMREAKRKK